MIIDVTGIKLTPGNNGHDCLGNGEHYDESGVWIEICYNECDYNRCCIEEPNCNNCIDLDCPRNFHK